LVGSVAFGLPGPILLGAFLGLALLVALTAAGLRALFPWSLDHVSSI